MLEILTGKSSKVLKKSKNDTERSKLMDKYAQMKRFDYDCLSQVYAYYFM